MAVTETQRFDGLARQPLVLESNRVWRTYLGGYLLDTWQGKGSPTDGNFPEEWVASTVRAKNPGRQHLQEEGLSLIATRSSGKHITLDELIRQQPEMYLGKQHVERFGLSMALLVKVLDAGERLTIQVHPDKAAAKRKFGSEFGKTEAWYVISGRNIGQDEPYVLLGFKPGMNRQRWTELFEEQDIDGMQQALHRIPVQPGEVYLIEGGMPHAIGPGCFLIEIQEPTDYTLRTERVTPSGRELSDEACHQGIGFQSMMDCFHYRCYSLDALRERFVIVPKVVDKNDDAVFASLISESETDTFRMNELTVHRSYVDENNGKSFSTAIVLEGHGRIHWGDSESIPVQQGMTLFFPAMLHTVSWIREGDEALRVVRCYPPRS